jgi:anti-sigma-K factor RskA
VTSDDELLERLRRALDDAPPQPDPARLAAFRAEVDSAAEVVPIVVRRTPWLAIAAAVAGLVVGAGVVALVSDDDERGLAGDVEYDGPLLAPDGRQAGDLTVTEIGIGRVIELRTGALPILPTGEYYEVWFVGPGDSAATPNRISAGTFHPDRDGRSDVEFAAAVNPALYPDVEITAEPADGNPSPTGSVVLRTSISP